MRVGRAGESYEAIGHGPFNLENHPVLCDAAGPFGSPTSDSMRTMITPAARNALLVHYAFGGDEELDAALGTAETAPKTHCAAKVETRVIVRP